MSDSSPSSGDGTYKYIPNVHTPADGIHPFLEPFLEHKLHIPLGIFTDSAQDILCNPHAFIRVGIICLNQKRVALLDVSQFPDEEHMTRAQWRQAWPRYLEHVRLTGPDEDVEKLERHYSFLDAHTRPQLTSRLETFSAVMAFDIEVRRMYEQRWMFWKEVDRRVEFLWAQCQALHRQVVDLQNELIQTREELAMGNSHSRVDPRDRKKRRRYF